MKHSSIFSLLVTVLVLAPAIQAQDFFNAHGGVVLYHNHGEPAPFIAVQDYGSRALAAPALAQDGPFVYISYATCDPATLADADAAFARDYAPALNARVAAGDIIAWGRKRHSDGGSWTRANYTVAPTIDALMAFQESWQAEVGRTHTAARAALWASCPSHEDYIWRIVATSVAPSRVGRDRAPYDGTTFFACAQGGLDRADALIREAFAPRLDAMVRDGAITSWAWLAHVMGGSYTRMLIMDTTSPTATVHAWERLGEGISAPAGTEFDTLCPTHQDYIWAISSSR
jgi:hypothetical protein